ncbi:hypothetical protein [Bosea vaviloviae]|nr:hypothetical protein [Bosea vaviloviae]
MVRRGALLLGIIALLSQAIGAAQARFNLRLAKQALVDLVGNCPAR